METIADEMGILQAAALWHKAGMSIIPIAANGSKMPPLEWKKFQQQRCTPDEARSWWTNNPYGVGLICGAISGGLEMTELEGRANTQDSLDAIEIEAAKRGVDWLWKILLNEGYCEQTPSGGLHLLYRIIGHDVPGNTKLAKNINKEVLAETRGEGGLVVVAPSGGRVHNTGKPWKVLAGTIGQVPAIQWDDRCQLHEAIKVALDETPPEPEPITFEPKPRVESDGVRPGDDYNDRTTWDEILRPHGWQVHHVSGTETFWTRPGKDRRDGWSATTGYANDEDRLFVFSSSTEFEQEKPYSKFSAYTLLEHGGDYSRAAKELSSRGYGEKSSSSFVDIDEWASGPDATVATTTTAMAPGDAGQLEQPTPETVREPKRLPALERFTEKEAAKIALAMHSDRFRRVSEEMGWRYYADGTWHVDHEARIEQAMERTQDKVEQFCDMDISRTRDKIDACVDTEQIKELKKHITTVSGFSRSMQSQSKKKALKELFAGQRGISCSIQAFDQNKNLLRLGNGTLNLSTREFREHRPEDMLTKGVDYAYDPNAQAPRFRQFMSEILPNPEVRAYLQRLVGYTLTAEANEGVYIQLWGKTRCGKSTFLEVIQKMFGDFSYAMPEGMLAEKSKGSSFDVHGMMGKRFAFTSETEEGMRLNEALLKRLSGNDTMTTAEKYEKSKTWRPEAVIWLITNFPPALSPDDGALWERLKHVHLPNQFKGDARDIDLPKKLAEELPGILNWALEGLDDYRANGLGEPETITDAVSEHRNESDTVWQFVDSADEHGRVEVTGESTDTIKQHDLYGAYLAWCSDNFIKPLGHRRFGNRLSAMTYRDFEFDSVKRGGIRMRCGIKVGAMGLVGAVTSTRAGGGGW